SAKADRPCSSLLGRMHLPEREDGLAVALLIEGDEHSESTGVVFLIRAVHDLDECRGLHSEKNHSIAVARAIGSDHVKPPDPARTEVDLLGFDRHAFGPKPHRS